MTGDSGESGMPPISDRANRDFLSYKEFVALDNSGKPRYNNFYLHFGLDDYNQYRSREYYKKFEHEYPELAISLCDKIQNKRDKQKPTTQSMKPFELDLYSAYMIMRSYEIDDDKLFS